MHPNLAHIEGNIPQIKFNGGRGGKQTEEKKCDNASEEAVNHKDPSREFNGRAW